jgi:hexosaminidase
MKKIIALALMLCPVWLAYAQQAVNIIPQPLSVVVKDGKLMLNEDYKIVDKARLFTNEISIFNNQLIKAFDFSLKTAKKSKQSIQLVFDDQLPHPEAYTLTITTKGIIITGKPAGVFYGLQSLYQLMINARESQLKVFALPMLRIQDQPTFQWRGMHLDVSRHFFNKAEVMRYLDYLALHKMNNFHWHLTDDQGWRIEVKKYPLLTSIGSKRSGTIIGPYSTTAPSDNIPYGGFYTQEDIREVIAYATARHITIVPEIEMPGHALAALSAYPELSCKGGTFQSAITWGVFDDVFCAGKDETFTFLENVLAEVIDLFPGKYIHIGGDECPKTRWKTCSLCQQRITAHNLKDEHDLQSYFITRIEKFVNSKGRQIIGWDEILEGGLAPNASVMSWRGTEGGIAAARLKHPAVMSPGQPCYFDHYQVKEKENEPLAFGGYNSLEAVYTYNPMPTELTVEEQQYILGAQGNLWTEYVPDFKQVEYMALPRMCALAETLWTKPEQKNYSGFLTRLRNHARLLDIEKANYAKHFLNTKP